MRYLYTLSIVALACLQSNAQWSNIHDNQKVSYLPGSAHNQVVIPDNQGGCYVIWQDERGQVNIDQIYAQHFDSTGTPSWAADGIALSPTSNLQNHMVAVADGQGGVFVLWRDLRDTTNLPGSTGPDIWGQRIDQSGQLWGNGKGLITEPGEQGAPLIVADQSGGFIFSFEDGGDFQASRSEGYWMQRADANGVAMWSAGGELVHKQSSSFSTSIDLALASDGQNGAVLVYNETAFDPNTATNIYGHRMDQGGNRHWAPVADTIAGIVIERGYPICDAQGSQTNPRIDLDDKGNLIVGWQDKRDPTWQHGALFAQRLMTDGTFLWNTNALQISPSDMGSANRFDLAADQHGGVYFEYATSGFMEHDLIRFGLDGTPAWTNPVNISNNMTYNSRLNVNSDGGAAITWLATGINQPGSEDGIMAQIFDSTGTKFQSGGILMSSYPEDKGAVEMAAGPQGGIFACWVDFRRTMGQGGANADSDLFVQGLKPASIGMDELVRSFTDFHVVSDKGMINIYFHEPLNAMAQVVLMDFNGRVVTEGRAEPGILKTHLNTGKFANGVYVLGIETSGEMFTRKVIVW